MTPVVELVFFSGCPHVAEARARLQLALARASLPQAWAEWNVELATTPPHYRKFGSPTILVNGVDISGGAVASGVSCVVSGAPSVDAITGALLGRRQ